MTSSESLEIPFKPKSCALEPAFMEPPATKAISSQWERTGISNIFAYFIAVFSKPEEGTLFPSSLMAQAPAFAILPILDNSSPFCPLVMAPMGKMCTTPSLSAFNLMYSTCLLYTSRCFLSYLKRYTDR